MTIHVYQADSLKRTRRHCPYHKQLCYGTLGFYYDTTHLSFDCGTFVDFGYEYWKPPPKSKCPKCRKHFRPIELIKHLEEHELNPPN